LSSMQCMRDSALGNVHQVGRGSKVRVSASGATASVRLAIPGYLTPTGPGANLRASQIVARTMKRTIEPASGLSQLSLEAVRVALV
jgi:hypothetical protein